MTAFRVLSASLVTTGIAMVLLAFGTKIAESLGLEKIYTSVEVAAGFLGGAIAVMLYHYRLEVGVERLAKKAEKERR